MGAFVTLIAVATIIIQIVIIVKFFGMSSDLAKLKAHFCDFETINADSARLAILTGTTDSLYKTIIEKTYLIISNSGGTDRNSINNKIAAAASLCAMIGRELPSQLQSVEAFEKFIKEVNY